MCYVKCVWPSGAVSKEKDMVRRAPRDWWGLLLAACICSWSMMACDEGKHTRLYGEAAASCQSVDSAAGGSCGDVPADGAAGEGAIRELMPAYYDFLRSLKASGYSFMDFATYWNADKQTLPEKLLVVRHDVHARDVSGAYCMRQIERALLPEASATYFVLLGFPPELKRAAKQARYLDLINWLSGQGVDVQPHISPNDMYVATYHTTWAKDSLSKLEKVTSDNYTIEQHDDGVDIDAIPDDALDIRLMNGRLVDLLQKYNQDWTKLTGLTVNYYAAHGSHIAVNLVMNNATLLDQRELLATGIYEFDAYNTQIHQYIGDLTDSEEPAWMDHPETIEPGRYEFLAHPYLWQADATAERLAREAEADAASAAADETAARSARSSWPDVVSGYRAERFVLHDLAAAIKRDRRDHGGKGRARVYGASDGVLSRWLRTKVVKSARRANYLIVWGAEYRNAGKPILTKPARRKLRRLLKVAREITSLQSDGAVVARVYARR